MHACMRRVAIVWSDQTGQDLGCGRGTANHDLGVINHVPREVTCAACTCYASLKNVGRCGSAHPKGGCREHGMHTSNWPQGVRFQAVCQRPLAEKWPQIDTMSRKVVR